MSRYKPEISSPVVLIVGAVGATLLGGLAALEFDRIAAVGQRLMIPAGQDALLKAVATAGLTGFLLWVICALSVRAVSGIALRPYDALADRLERMVDGDLDDLADLHGPVVGVRRLARAIFVFQEKAMASQRSEARLQARYDALYQEHADERRLLLQMLTGRGEVSTGEIRPVADAATPATFDIPAPPERAMRLQSPAPQAFQVIDLAGRLTPARPAAVARAMPSGMFDFGPLNLAVGQR